MPRNIDQLRAQYNSSASDKRNRGPSGPRGGGPGVGGASGKPKDAGKTLSRLVSYAKGYTGRIIAVLVCMVLSTVTSLIGGYMLAPVINRLTAAVAPETAEKLSLLEQKVGAYVGVLSNGIFGEDSVLNYISSAMIILGAVYLVGVATTYVQSRLMLSVSQGIIERIRNDLFEKLQRLPVRYFDGHPTGEIMSRFTNDIDNIDVMINNSLTSLISGAVTLIGTLVFMLTTSWILTLIVIAFFPIFAFGGAKIAGLSRKYYVSQQAALGAVNGYMETLAVTIGVGGILMLNGLLGAGGLTVFSQYARQFSMPINQISQQMATVFAALAGAERVFEVMDTDPETADREGAVDLADMKGYVVLDNVTFGYVPGKTVLKHISLYAKPGQKIAFVGSTGAGKTTVTNLLNRFYDIEEGSITIDGVDIRDIKREQLRKNIAMVLQDTHLFTGTVMENIRYGRLDATDDEVIEAAKTASAHSFIMRLSDGYNTMLEGDGANLSQGQRQLLNIARAALSKAPILVLDEATSSVDTRTERHIEHGMDRLMKNRTTFVIAHRLSTVRNSNAIMVLEAGEIIERGSHEELLEMKGRYYELYTGKKELD